ncbi:hypothetical protein BP5796_11295 [Coleophoma crateriformis]|uniref:Uncharacterized protein n=1 Tax=Coleophoma crateriformis TaxID=565419 RepID=A0A3D8QHS6_9HELO|nr:hypothetical protein BP5796_11295 [Coleophoma crateriformis]
MESSPPPALAGAGPGIRALQQLPPDCERMRKLLFEMPVPFSMRAEVFDRYWLLVDNVWCKQYQGIVGGNIVGGPKVTFESIRLPCRFARSTYENAQTRTGPPVTKRKRREGGTCSCRVKAKLFRNIAGIPDHYLFDHSSQKESDWEHSHTLDESDSYKINSFLKTAAAEEIAKGQMPAEVFKALREVALVNQPRGSALAAAGGKYMTRQHVGNAKQSLERPSTTDKADSAATSAAWSRVAAPVSTSPANTYSSPYANGDAPGTLQQPNQIQDTTSAMMPTQVYDVPVNGNPQTFSQPVPNKNWPSLGRQSENHREHKAHIKMDIRLMFEGTTPGSQIPREVLLPFLNSVLIYLDRDADPVDGKALLAAIQSVKETAIATRENTEHLMSRHGFYGAANGGV